MNSSGSQEKYKIQRTACGRIGCVTVYKTDDCHLCDAMNTYMTNLVKAEGLSENIINTVTKIARRGEPDFDEIHSVPAIRVCETVMTGIPDDDMVRNSLRSAKHKKCFLEDVT